MLFALGPWLRQDPTVGGPYMDLVSSQTAAGDKTWTGSQLIQRGNGLQRYLELRNANDANSFGRIENSSSAASTFAMGILSRQASHSNGAALLLQADVDATQDNSLVPAIIAQSRRVGGTALTMRPLFGVLSGANQYPYRVLADATHDFRDNAGNQTVTLPPSGNVQMRKAGAGLQVTEGANCKQGVATLVAGTVTVANTSVTANSRIFLTAQDNNSTGALRVSARTAGTSFTITSSNGADNGVVAYEIFEPS